MTTGTDLAPRLCGALFPVMAHVEALTTLVGWAGRDELICLADLVAHPESLLQSFSFLCGVDCYHNRGELLSCSLFLSGQPPRILGQLQFGVEGFNLVL